MKIFKQLAGQTIVYGLGTMIPRVLNYLLLTPFYTRIFLAEQYGVITEIYAYVAFLMVLLTYGMETTYFRFASSDSNTKIVFNTAFSSLIITSLLFVGIVFLNISSIADGIGYGNNVQYVKWFVLIVALDAVTAIPFAKLRQENKAFVFALIKVGNILINIGFNVFFFMICRNSSNELLASLYKPEIGVGYAFLSNLFASLFNLIVLSPQFRFFSFKFDFKLFRKMLVYALPLLIVGLAGMVNEVADKILIKYLTPEAYNPMKQLGIYGANYKLAVLMTIFIQMFKYAAEPFFFNQAKNKDAKMIYAQVMNYFVIFCLIIFLLVTLFLDVFKYFIDPDYFEGLFIVPIVLLANMFLGIYYNLSVWYKLTNLTRFGAYIALFGVSITLIVNILFIPKFGYLASSWSHFICYGLMMILSYFVGKRYYKVDYDVGNIFIYTLVAISMFVLHTIFKDFYNINLVLGSFLFVGFLMFVIKREKLNILDLKLLFKK